MLKFTNEYIKNENTKKKMKIKWFELLIKYDIEKNINNKNEEIINLIIQKGEKIEKLNQI